MCTRLSIPLVFVIVLAVMPLAPVAAVAPDPIMAVGFVPAEPLQMEFDAFTTMTGIQVLYEELGDENTDPFEDLRRRIESGEGPDVVVGVGFWRLFELEEELVDLSQFVKAENLKKRFSDYLLDMATGDDGSVLGAPISAFLKTLVWYKPAEFGAAGYAIPESFGELVALSDQMVDDGRFPWCNYIGSDGATGWVGTDWIEDLLLGAEGPEVYDGWVHHDVLFSDERVEAAFVRYQQMIDTPGYVFDRENMLGVGLQENVQSLDDGDCLMHRQADFFGGFDGVDGQFSTFKFPSVGPEFEDAAMGGAGYVAALDDRKDVGKLIKFMVSAEFGEAALADSGGWLLPHRGFDRSFYPNEMVRSWAEIVRNALKDDLFRFDGSDLMPDHIGADAFWAVVRDLVAGRETIPGVLTHLDAGWNGAYPVVMPGWTTGGPLYEPAYVLVDALPEPDEGTFFVIRAESPREMYDLLCGMRDTAVGIGVDTLVYSFASTDCELDASFKAIRFGYDSYWTQFLVARDSEMEDIADLDGESWAISSFSSLSSYVVPRAMMAEAEITPGDTSERDGHNGAARAVYEGEQVFATTFYSPYTEVDGNVGWDFVPDHADIPGEFVPDCHFVTVGEETGAFAEGDLVCGYYEVRDARRNVVPAEAPDIVQQVRILALSEPIPNDAVAFGADFPSELRGAVETALGEFEFEGSDFGALYSWQGINPASDDDWNWIRSALLDAGFDVDGSLPSPQFGVDPSSESMWGDQFAADGSVTVTVNSVEVPGSPFTTDEWGFFDAGWDPAVLDLQAGDLVEVSDGTTSKDHTITELAVTGVDPVADVVSGVAAPGSELEVWVHGVDAWRHVTACDNEAFPCGGELLGTWNADFGTAGDEPGEEGLADLVAGSNGNSGQCDNDGDCTNYYWAVPAVID